MGGPTVFPHPLPTSVVVSTLQNCAALGGALCGALPPPAWEGRPGAEAALVSNNCPTLTYRVPIRQRLGAANAQTAHPATSSTAPAHHPLGSTNAETTPAGG